MRIRKKCIFGLTLGETEVNNMRLLYPELNDKLNVGIYFIFVQNILKMI